MSMNVPGWTPGAPGKDDAPVCGRCGHHASAHLHATRLLGPGPLVAALPVQRLHPV